MVLNVIKTVTLCLIIGITVRLIRALNALPKKRLLNSLSVCMLLVSILIIV